MKQPSRTGFLAVACIVIVSIQTASAGGIVANCDETSLRAAMLGGGQVTFTCDGVITLASVLTVTNDTSLNGSGHAVTISGGNLTRLLWVQPGVTLKLQNLTLENGIAPGTNGVVGPTGGPGGPGYGGAIYSDHALVQALDCAFRSNTALGGTGGDSTNVLAAQSGVGGPGAGGAVYLVSGSFAATNCAFALNQAMGGTGGGGQFQISTGGIAAGGAIYNLGGTLELFNCQISSNNATGGAGRRFNVTGASYGGTAQGGAIYSTTGDVSIVRSTLSSNADVSGATIASFGGAIYQDGGALKLIDSTLATNIVTGGRQIFGGNGAPFPGADAFGGAIYVAAGTLALSNSTLAGNAALGGSVASDFTRAGSGLGGGVYNLATVQAANSTFVGNLAQGGGVFIPYYRTPGASSGFGGGFYNAGGSLSLDYATLAGNRAATGPGAQVTNSFAQGGAVFSTNGTASVHCSILANSPTGDNAFGTLTDAGHNLSTDASCNFAAPGSLNNVNANLGPLGDYGGPTKTVPLLGGSAIDGGDNASCLATDQRGRARPYGSACDIGAFESSPPFVIRGNVSGFTLKHEVAITNGSTSVQTLNGYYSLDGLAPGNYTITPVHSNYLFVPTSYPVSLGPDRLELNFKAYQWNTLSPEGISNGTFHVVFAGTNGLSYRVEASSNLLDWESIRLQQPNEFGYLDFFDPVAGTRFYRVVTP